MHVNDRRSAVGSNPGGWRLYRHSPETCPAQPLSHAGGKQPRCGAPAVIKLHFGCS